MNTKPRPDAAGVSALDTKLEEALKSYEVSFTLLPAPSKQAVPKTAPAQPSAGGKPTAPAAAKGNRKGSNRFRPYSSKGKGKGKFKADQRVPREIREAGGTASMPTGEPICFDFSLKKCKEPVEGSRCKKGFHVCAICYGQHCMLDHKKARLPQAPEPIEMNSACKRKSSDTTVDLHELPIQDPPKRCRSDSHGNKAVQKFSKPRHPDTPPIPETDIGDCTGDVFPMHSPSTPVPMPHVLPQEPEEAPKFTCTEQAFSSQTMPKDPFFIELCAGSARVTTCLQFFWD